MPHFGPPEKSSCGSFAGKEHKKGTHINFFGAILGSKTGTQTGRFGPQRESLVYCVFPALTLARQNRYTCASDSAGLNGDAEEGAKKRLRAPPLSKWPEHFSALSSPPHLQPTLAEALFRVFLLTWASSQPFFRWPRGW